MPYIPVLRALSACSFGGDKVFVLGVTDLHKSSVNILHNPGATVSSQKMHWQSIEVLGNFLESQHLAAIAPLNSTEIVILGGMPHLGSQITSGEVVIFNTTSCKFKKVAGDKTEDLTTAFIDLVKVCENTILALC